MTGVQTCALPILEDLTAGDVQPMEDERITVKWFKPREIDKMIRDGKIMDAKTMVGFLAWKRYGGKAKDGKRSK